MQPPCWKLAGYALLLATLTAGCKKEETIRAYSAPKETVSPAPMAAVDLPAQGDEILTLDMPSNWRLLPATGKEQLAVASFGVPAPYGGLVLSAYAFEQNADNSDLAKNVARWAGQVNLELPPTGDYSQWVKKIDANGMTVNLIDMPAPDAKDGFMPQETLLAFFTHANRAWTLKFVSPGEKSALAAQLSAQKANFEKCAASIRFKPADKPAVKMPAQPETPSARPALGSNDLQIAVPSGWTRLPDRQMRYATLQAGGANVIISRFPGQVGSLLDNLNRWRGEVGLAPLANDADAKPAATTIAGLPAAIYSFDGAAQASRVATLSRGNEMWFIKLIGPAGEVAQQAQEFEKFLQSLKFGGD